MRLGPPVAQVFNLCAAPLRAAHAPSPDVRSGPPGLRSLDAACAPPSMAALVSNAGSRGMGNPSGDLIQEARFVREDHEGSV